MATTLDPTTVRDPQTGFVRPRTGPADIPKAGGIATPMAEPPAAPPTPGVQTAPPGRPPAETAGQGVGTGITINMGGAPPAPPSAPSAAPAPAPAAPAPAAPEMPTAAMPSAAYVSGFPSRRQLASYPPGTAIETPYGPIVENPETGRRSVQLTPAGQARYMKDVAAMKTRLSPHPAVGDPNAPQPNLVPGRPFFDPFGGRFIR